MFRLFCIVFLGLALTVTAANREAFFRTAYYEEGDDAANALQIYRAKYGRELHGNYSRWGFHHPGPAFFYAYAAGEWLLFDLTGIAPAPRNAHIYTGTLVQLAFYAAAVTILAWHVRRRLLVLALALAAGAWHYRHVDRIIYSVWPPDVLLMPFLCFVVACAALSLGRRNVLPAFVISASFLVHGHIAQPLFVVPMSLLALWLAWRGRGREAWRDLRSTRTGQLSLALLIVFVAPLVIDLFAGRNSNAHDVLLHLRFQTDGGQSLWQSILCLGSAFVGVQDPTTFTALAPEDYAIFRERALWLIGWGVALGFAAWRLWSKSSAGADAEPERLLGRRVLMFAVVAGALTLVWGMRQDGGFTNFNSHFNHSLVHAFGWVVVIAIATLLPRVVRWVGAFAASAGIVGFAVAIPHNTDIGSRGDELEVRLTALLLADPKPDAPKLITFSQENWYEAVTLGRAFQRRGIDFYVHPTWEIMFGEDHLLRDRADLLSNRELSVWHVVRRNHAPKGSHVLNRECALLFPGDGPAQAFPITIDFGRDQHVDLPSFGIGLAEDNWVWTDGRVTALTLNAPRASAPLTLTLEASGYVTSLTKEGQRAEILLNGLKLGEARFDEERKTVRLTVPTEGWNRHAPQTLLFKLPDAVSPASAGWSGDRRELGLRLYTLTIAPDGN